MMIALSTIPSARAQGLAGGIRGTVTDAEFGGAVAGVQVRILELFQSLETTDDGLFLFKEIPAGSYTLTFTKAGYERQLASGVIVTPGALADLTIRLNGEFNEMEEFVVRDLELSSNTGSELGLLQLRANTLSFQDSVGKELMSKAGASDAAAALKLVVGTSIVDGKYASVRGLGDRYVGAAVNGLRVPGSDPKRRAVQLDIFPAGTIDSISVSKTFTPDLPGDYSGGGINIRLNTIPDEPFAKFSFTREYNRDYTGKDGFVTYEGGGVDRWARQRGERDLVAGAADMEINKLNEKGLQSFHDELVSPEFPHADNYLEYDRITRAMSPAMGTKREEVPPNHSWNYSLGGRTKLFNGWDLGGIAALTYGQKYTLTQAAETDYTRPNLGNEQVTNLINHTRDVGTGETKLGMLIGGGFTKDKDQSLTLNYMRNRAGTDQASIRIEEHDPTNSIYWQQKQAIQYTERSIESLQIKGDHKWDNLIAKGLGLRMNWFGTHNIAQQYEPDVRQFDNYVIPRPDGLYTLQPRAPGTSGADEESSTRIWRNTKEDNSQYGMNFAVPFDRNFDSKPMPGAPETKSGALKFGWLTDLTRRTYEQNSFYYAFPTQADPVFTGPVRSQFPPGRTGQAQYVAALNAWQASPEGLAYTEKSSDAANDRNRAFAITNNPNALWTDTFTNPDNIGSGDYQNSMYWFILPKIYDVSYEGDQQLPAGYAMFEIPVTRRLNLMFGMRVENTRMTAEPASDAESLDPARAFQIPVQKPLINPDGTTNYFYTISGVPKEEATVDLNESHWLRAASLVYDLTPTMKLRYNYGQTIARPTFLEIAPVITFDYIEGEAFVGNADLQISTIDNYDIRWEWFRKPDQVFSVSWFYKAIINPIDKESFGYLGQDYVIAVNYPRGRVRGAEFELRTPLPPPPYLPGKLTFGANYTMIDAKVQIPDGLQNDLAAHDMAAEERDMEGQPAYLANVNLTYDFGYGTSVSLFYNRRGDMLKTGAAIGEDGATPDVYLLAKHSLDLGIQQKIGKHLTATFRIKNMAEQDVHEVYRLPDGTEITKRIYSEGIAYALSIGGSW